MQYQRGVVELEFMSSSDCLKPYRDVDLFVEFKLDEREFRVRGFWNGNNCWKVRFAPPSAGRWKWTSICSDESNIGLHSQSGAIEIVPYDGINPIYRHGFITITDNQRGLMHEDKTPFFWLGDTVWSVTAHATLEEWEKYIRLRSAQGFNVVQINTLPQWDASGAPLRQPFQFCESGNQCWDLYCPNEEYFRFLDAVCDVAIRSGIVVSLVVLWCNYVPGTNPTWESLPRDIQFDEQSARRYAQYLEARYGAYGPIWIVSGDSDYNSDSAISIYDVVGQTIAESSAYHPLLTAHLNGGMYTPDILNQTAWLSFHMFQSCHTLQSVKNAVEYAEHDRSYLPVRPVMNGEPCYENIRFLFPGDPDARSERKFIRKVAWVSILSGATAGITYGTHGLWDWHREGQSYTHLQYGVPEPWETAVLYESANDFVKLKNLLRDLDWWDLVPCNHLIEERTEDTWAASTTDDCKIVVYSSHNYQLQIAVKGKLDYLGYWLNPTNGARFDANIEIDNGKLSVNKLEIDADWVLILTRTSTTV